MTISDPLPAQQRWDPVDPDHDELLIPTQDRTEPDPDEFDESHLVRGYD
ncbi:hypothetical protein [Saccharopolyspora hordei]|uniref:Uncharacterized protein n=1 Tax=Saccharopolyspora hordei TaxID=1838 RepID=A0A853AS18_9PSEU|nr:hypothetical protein [Saccharopolyspora hordei]NYI84620.1 hypothetical protein [Saccharopolyspora hordei]